MESVIGKTKQKRYVYGILYPIKISLENEGKIKTSTNKSYINPRPKELHYNVLKWKKSKRQKPGSKERTIKEIVTI